LAESLDVLEIDLVGLVFHCRVFFFGGGVADWDLNVIQIGLATLYEVEELLLGFVFGGRI